MSSPKSRRFRTVPSGCPIVPGRLVCRKRLCRSPGQTGFAGYQPSGGGSARRDPLGEACLLRARYNNVLAGRAGSGMARSAHWRGAFQTPSRRLPEAYSEPPTPAMARCARPPADPCRGGRTRVRAGPRRRDGYTAPMWAELRSVGPNPAQLRARQRCKR